MNLFQHGDVVLHSGSVSKWKIECDALTDEDWETLALMLSQKLQPFKTVEGVPRGGLKLAKALQKYCGSGGNHLIVDDVLTSGKSMKEARRAIKKEVVSVAGAVVFARNYCEMWITPLFQM